MNLESAFLLLSNRSVKVSDFAPVRGEFTIGPRFADKSEPIASALSHKML